MDALAQAMAAWSKVPSNVITSGFKAVQEQAIHFAKENAETSFTLASELTQDLQNVLTLQSRYPCSHRHQKPCARSIVAVVF
jgi:hypothetical protein